MATKHKGSPPSDPSSAPESGTVRDQPKSDTTEMQHKRPPKGASAGSSDRSNGKKK